MYQRVHAHFAVVVVVVVVVLTYHGRLHGLLKVGNVVKT